MGAVTLWEVDYWVGWVQLGVSFWSEGMCRGLNLCGGCYCEVTSLVASLDNNHRRLCGSGVVSLGRESRAIANTLHVRFHVVW